MAVCKICVLPYMVPFALYGIKRLKYTCTNFSLSNYKYSLTFMFASKQDAMLKFNCLANRKVFFLAVSMVFLFELKLQN